MEWSVSRLRSDLIATVWLLVYSNISICVLSLVLALLFVGAGSMYFVGMVVVVVSMF